MAEESFRASEGVYILRVAAAWSKGHSPLHYPPDRLMPTTHDSAFHAEIVAAGKLRSFASCAVIEGARFKISCHLTAPQHGGAVRIRLATESWPAGKDLLT